MFGWNRYCWGGHSLVKSMATPQIWWRRRELNPRPLARHYWLYMLRVRLLI